MAILERNGALHGTAGTVVFRRFRNSTVVQGLPKRKKKQTPASQASAGEFGVASTAAAAIRLVLRSVFRNRHDGAMVNRFNSAVYQSILRSKTALRGARDLHDGDLSCLEGFEFNANSPLREALRVRPTVSLTSGGKVRVQMDGWGKLSGLKIPSAVIEAADSYRLRFLVTALNFRSEFYEYVAVKDVTVTDWKDMEALDFEMEGTIPEGCMVLVTASLDCLGVSDTGAGGGLVNTPSFSPAAILAAFRTTEPLSLQEPLKVRKEAGGRHPGLCYAGNELLEKMAEVAQKRKAREQRGGRRVRADGIAGSGTGRNGPEGVVENERGVSPEGVLSAKERLSTDGDEGTPFVLGKRFSL
ncbi:hypothetical protein [Pararcticibacter amylolyticus]|uniref:Uncharacterized protein n=1 Tax=Pararcticibacter amylolyticus TaxID=2173175 RepID=A0A2U2PLV2_9SPHI|nr:hypothetical protein [Pararcticibacter amylolyticus]PWG82385.1 hypothetical protein DDR33_00495 [Pararcticibacter amylolyticus]